MATPPPPAMNPVPASRRSRRRWPPIIAGLAFVSGLLGLALALFRPAPEPSYAGRTITDWLKAADWDSDRGRAELAASILGDSAVPAFRHHLKAGTWAERRIWLELPPRWQARWRRQSRLFGYRLRALEALENVPELARHLTPELLHVLADRSEPTDTRVRAFRALALTHPDPTPLRDTFQRVAGEGGLLGGAAGKWLADSDRREADKKRKAVWEARAGSTAGPPPAPPQAAFPSTLPTGLNLSPR